MGGKEVVVGRKEEKEVVMVECVPREVYRGDGKKVKLEENVKEALKKFGLRV